MTFIYPRPTGPETTIVQNSTKKGMDIWKKIEKFFYTTIWDIRCKLLSDIKNFIGDHLFKIFAAIILLYCIFYWFLLSLLMQFSKMRNAL